MKPEDVEGYENFPPNVKRLIRACGVRDDRVAALGQEAGGPVDEDTMRLLWNGLDLDYGGVTACAVAGTQLHQAMMLGAPDTFQARLEGLELPPELDCAAREQLVGKVAHIIQSVWADGLLIGELDAQLRLSEERQLLVPGPDDEPQPGVMHPVDQAFYDLAVKERDYERRRADRFQAAERSLRQQLEEAHAALREARRGAA